MSSDVLFKVFDPVPCPNNIWVCNKWILLDDVGIPIPLDVAFKRWGYEETLIITEQKKTDGECSFILLEVRGEGWILTQKTDFYGDIWYFLSFEGKPVLKSSVLMVNNEPYMCSISPWDGRLYY